MLMIYMFGTFVCGGVGEKHKTTGFRIYDVAKSDRLVQKGNI